MLGLAIYSLLYYTAILLFNVTLTLPGFAGLILTIGGLMLLFAPIPVRAWIKSRRAV